MQSWLFILLFMIIAVIVPFAAILTARILGPRKPNPIKQSTYECGMETVGESWVQFKAQYYVFALIFLVFDVETVFLFPWAISLNALPQDRRSFSMKLKLSPKRSTIRSVG